MRVLVLVLVGQIMMLRMLRRKVVVMMMMMQGHVTNVELRELIVHMRRIS